jgi:hypothetical protein
MRTAPGPHGWSPGSISGASEFKRTHNIGQFPHAFERTHFQNEARDNVYDTLEGLPPAVT